MAKKLGIAYYDKNIIGQIAEKSGLSPEYIQESAELSPKKGLFAYAFAGRDITGKSVEDMVYEAQRKVILELAEKESCVIIGRNADFILKDRDDVLNVFIHGDMPEKIQRIIGLYNVEEQEAVKMMADTDKRRMTNYNFYTEQKWGKASNYTLCLNSSQLGYDRCEDYCRIRFLNWQKKIPNEDGVIKAFELAPEGIVTDIYPKQENEGAFGLDMLQEHERKKDAVVARDSGKYTIGGPYQLKQERN